MSKKKIETWYDLGAHARVGRAVSLGALALVGAAWLAVIAWPLWQVVAWVWSW